ncbi:MAG TPA: hypothetical protein VMV10_02170 [Pirellulales bacterium]|nr:hypothetical protein [Pirellulales bacterium]
MSSQGPIIVATGVDGGEDPGGIWVDPTAASSTSSASFASGQAGYSASLNTNTLKCQFNAGQFGIPALYAVTGIKITFQALASSSGTPIVNVQSVKTSLTTRDASDGASLGTTFASYSYSMPMSPLLPSAVNGAWEIDLVFSSPGGASSGNVDVYDVAATVTYELIDINDPGAIGMDPVSIVRRRPHFQPPPIESIDPHALTLPNAPEPIHPEVLAPMFVSRAPTPQSRTYLAPIMGDYDPTSLTLPI